MVLGSVLSWIYTRHYIEEKQIELLEQGQKLAVAFTQAYRTGDLTDLTYELQILQEYMGAKVLMVNENGTIVLASPGMNNVFIGGTFAYPKITEGVLQGDIVLGQAMAKEDGFAEDTLIVAYPLQTGDMIGILMCHPMPEMNQSLSEIYKAGMWGIVVVCVIFIFIIYVASQKIVKPLKEMNEMAKIIAGGNYEKRVAIYGEDEVGQLGRSFNNMAKSIQNNEKSRRDFIANVSHDLRSPLTSMHGFLTAMLDGTIPPERQEKYLNIVLEETNRLTRITEGIADLSHAQNDTILINLTKFDLNDMIRNNITIMEPQLNEKKIVIQAIYADKETLVYGDSDKISRVLQNLINNAIKFSHYESVIEIETTIKNEKVFVSIQDEGIGIAKEQQKYIFDRFYKADATRNEDKQGSGLGLAIVREFLNAHGEKISVKSVLEQGTTFVFSLRLWDEKKSKS